MTTDQTQCRTLHDHRCTAVGKGASDISRDWLLLDNKPDRSRQWSLVSEAIAVCISSCSAMSRRAYSRPLQLGPCIFENPQNHVSTSTNPRCQRRLRILRSASKKTQASIGSPQHEPSAICTQASAALQIIPTKKPHHSQLSLSPHSTANSKSAPDRRGSLTRLGPRAHVGRRQIRLSPCVPV